MPFSQGVVGRAEVKETEDGENEKQALVTFAPPGKGNIFDDKQSRCNLFIFPFALTFLA